MTLSVVNVIEGFGERPALNPYAARKYFRDTLISRATALNHTHQEAERDEWPGEACDGSKKSQQLAVAQFAVGERFCTGDATPFEKFQAWAKTVPHTLRNPLYHWTHSS